MQSSYKRIGVQAMQNKRIVFQFGNNTSPRYIEALFLPLQAGQWYSRMQLIDILHNKGYNIEGEHTISHNTVTWALAGLGELNVRRAGNNPKNLFRLTELGRQLSDMCSTNAGLFYDVLHFLFYSAYRRAQDIKYSRFWLYPELCDILWSEAPVQVKAQIITNRLQIEFCERFPGSNSAFNDISTQVIFPWLRALDPPFLTKSHAKSWAIRRVSCTPQLFHLATDFIYSAIERLDYGTSLAIRQPQIEAICKVCLLDPEHFWKMANLAQMTISGFEIHQGQWEKAILLDGPPDWIALPDFAQEQSSTENDLEEDDDA
ncbi:MAG: hypothetical protein ACRDHZ_01620 [Ktedonobacteraceae bacterium]